jgi:hypothetical protein
MALHDCLLVIPTLQQPSSASFSTGEVSGTARCCLVMICTCTATLLPITGGAKTACILSSGWDELHVCNWQMINAVFWPQRSPAGVPRSVLACLGARLLLTQSVLCTISCMHVLVHFVHCYTATCDGSCRAMMPRQRWQRWMRPGSAQRSDGCCAGEARLHSSL